jgi:hypothetical protein
MNIPMLLCLNIGVDLARLLTLRKIASFFSSWCTCTKKNIPKRLVVVLIHTYHRGEVSNPLGVSLEAQA